MLILSDFDGTISKQDSLKWLLHEYMGEKWAPIEKAMVAGEISERQALKQASEEMPLSRDEAIELVAERIELDDHFKHFVAWSQLHDFRLVVLSGGYVEFIEAIFKRNNLPSIEVFANRMEGMMGQGWKTLEPTGPRLCEFFSHCKCASMLRSKTKTSEHVVYIGDGLTDKCVAGKAHKIFAKSWLAEYCQEQKLEHEVFSNFQNVWMSLSADLEVASSRKAAAQPSFARA